MNILDENIPESQRRWLQSKRVPVRQTGQDIGRTGMKADEIIALLHQLNRPTFFTLDADFYDRRFCHEAYCSVHLDVEDDLVAEYVRRLLHLSRLANKVIFTRCQLLRVHRHVPIANGMIRAPRYQRLAVVNELE